MAALPADEGWQPDAGLVARIDTQLGRWRQGDVARPGLSLHVGNGEWPLVAEDCHAHTQEPDAVDPPAIMSDVEAGAIISQTCDLVHSSGKRPFVQVCPVVSLSGNVCGNAAAGKVPRYAPLPGLGKSTFADLDRCTTITKAVLAGMAQERGCPDDHSLVAFGQAVARHHGRFAFPSYMDSALAPLKAQMEKRAGKDSPEGRCVDALVEIRASATPQWDSDEPVTVEFTYIVDEAHLPAVDDLETPVSGEIAA